MQSAGRSLCCKRLAHSRWCGELCSCRESRMAHCLPAPVGPHSFGTCSLAHPSFPPLRFLHPSPQFQPSSRTSRPLPRLLLSTPLSTRWSLLSLLLLFLPLNPTSMSPPPSATAAPPLPAPLLLASAALLPPHPPRLRRPSAGWPKSHPHLLPLRWRPHCLLCMLLQEPCPPHSCSSARSTLRAARGPRGTADARG